MPSKIRSISWLSNCVADFFTAYDPPRTLNPMAVLVPSTTVDVDPKTQARIQTQASAPGSMQQDPGASKTTPVLGAGIPSSATYNAEPRIGIHPAVTSNPDSEVTPTPASQDPEAGPNRYSETLIEDIDQGHDKGNIQQNSEARPTRRPAVTTDPAYESQQKPDGTGFGLEIDPNGPSMEPQFPAKAQVTDDSAQS